MRNKTWQQIGLAIVQQLDHLLRQDFLLQDDAAATEIAGLRFGDRFFADIGQAHFIHAAGAFRTWSERGLAGEIDTLAIFAFTIVLAEIEFQLEVLDLFIAADFQDRSKRPAHLGAEALQRTDGALGQQFLDFRNFKLTAARRLAHREFALGAGEATIIFLDHAATIRTRRQQRRIVAGDGVVIVFLGALDDDLGQLRDFAHELFTADGAALDLRQLVFPFAGQFRFGQFIDTEAVQQRHQLERLGSRHHFPTFAQQVFFVQQTFDDGSARRRRAEALAGHCFAQLAIVQQLAGAFHG